MQDDFFSHDTLVFISSDILLSKKSWITASLVRAPKLKKKLFNKIKSSLKWKEGMLSPFRVDDTEVT